MKIHYSTKNKIESNDIKTRYRAYRNASSAFIKKKDVRSALFKKYDNKCYICGSDIQLEIDHVISVYNYALNFGSIYELNSENNLAVICKKCNSSKLP